MIGPPPSSYPSQVPPPAAVISRENEEKSSGFDRNFTGFVLRRPATSSGNVGNSIYELGFDRISRGDSGHFRSVFGVRPRTKVTPN
ncbi:unnamed protein product [Prunus armeniaca]